jgi:hypothetical protein
MMDSHLRESRHREWRRPMAWEAKRGFCRGQLALQAEMDGVDRRELLLRGQSMQVTSGNSL